MKQDTSIEFWSRREFLEFMGKGYLASSLVGSMASLAKGYHPSALPFTPISPSAQDDLVLAKGFQSTLLAKHGDKLFADGASYGMCNDYVAFIPLSSKNPDEGILWVNHEYVSPQFLVNNWDGISPRTQKDVDQEMLMMGGSLLKVKRDPKSGQWKVQSKDALNRRITAKTPIPFAGGYRIQGSRTAMGTIQNCSGGVTPWSTVLSCEENYQNQYGEVSFTPKRTLEPGKYRWSDIYSYPPEHYGWVVEVDPLTGNSKKLPELGRFSHEGACVTQTKDGRCVVYMGDDKADECLYKFVASSPSTLEKGTLYVADLSTQTWKPITLDNPKLKGKFKNHTELLIRTREAAKILGGTPLARPEGIAIHPKDKSMVLACTNHKKRGNYFGYLLRVDEKDQDPSALSFTHKSLLAGGPKSGFACPDNITYDKHGNLWITTDISGSSMGKPPYTQFKNNGLFFVPNSGKAAGKTFQVASAPKDAEFTSPFFSPDGKTLFLSVQHPGEKSKPGKLTSHWPEGKKDSLPRSGLVALSGSALDRIAAKPLA